MESVYVYIYTCSTPLSSFWKDEIMKVSGKIGEICIGGIRERKLLRGNLIRGTISSGEKCFSLFSRSFVEIFPVWCSSRMNKINKNTRVKKKKGKKREGYRDCICFLRSFLNFLNEFSNIYNFHKNEIGDI